MSIFTTSTNDPHMSSNQDVGYEQSDMETSTSDSDLDEESPKDYWFGQKYFECILAQGILQHSRLYDSVARVDSRLERHTRQFPYAQALADLQAEALGPLLPANTPELQEDDYRTLMFCIGAVVRKGDRRHKATLLATLRQHRPSVEGSDLSSLRNGHIPNVGDHLRQQTRPFSSSQTSASELGRYATALKEHCDQRGIVPTYAVMELSRVPPEFRAVVSMGLTNHEGTARTKKQARHEAARAACHDMQIIV